MCFWTPNNVTPSVHKNVTWRHMTQSATSAMPFLRPGVMLFDCAEKTLEGIAEKMVTEMLKQKQIRPGDQEGMTKCLLQNRG